MRKLLLATTALFALSAFALSASAHADVVFPGVFTSDHCGGGCGPQAGGFATIDATQVGSNTVSITITPLHGNGLVGGLQGLTTFTFNSLQDQALTFNFGSNASLFDVSNSTTNTALSGTIHQDGFGDFEYGFNYTGGNGGSNPFTQPLTFTVSGAGLTLASFAERSTGGSEQAFFALDLISGTTGNTGVVDMSTAVPEPSTWAMMLIGFLGVGLFGMRGRVGSRPFRMIST